MSRVYVIRNIIISHVYVNKSGAKQTHFTSVLREGVGESALVYLFYARVCVCGHACVRACVSFLITILYLFDCIYLISNISS